MNDFLARQLRELSAAIERTGGRLIGSMILALLAALALAAGFGFLAAAAFMEITALCGLIIAAAAVGGGFVVLALIVFIILKLRQPRQPRKAATPKPSPAELKKTEAQAALAANIDESVAPLLKAFQAANMKPEEFALRLSSELTKQTGAFGLIALAVAAGFITARRLAGSGKS